MFFLSIALLALLWMNRGANRAAMDAYYEFLASSLAREPIEVFRGQGFQWLEKYQKGEIPTLEDYVLGETDLEDRPFARIQRPPEAAGFRRRITVTPVQMPDNSLKGFKVRVAVFPRASSRVSVWLSGGGEVALEALIFDRPQ